MSDTPQTDEAQFGTGRVSVDFASRLERELVETREQRDKWMEKYIQQNRENVQLKREVEGWKVVVSDMQSAITGDALAAVKGGSDNLKTKSIRLERWPHDPDPFNSPDHDNGQKNYT